jgi:hypothetical protein
MTPIGQPCIVWTNEVALFRLRPIGVRICGSTTLAVAANCASALLGQVMHGSESRSGGSSSGSSSGGGSSGSGGGGGGTGGGGGVALETLFVISLVAQLASLVPAALLANTAVANTAGNAAGDHYHHNDNRGRRGPKPSSSSSSSIGGGGGGDVGGGMFHSGKSQGGGGKRGCCGNVCTAAWESLRGVATLLAPPAVWLWCLWSLGGGRYKLNSVGPYLESAWFRTDYLRRWKRDAR